jgi:hypothetical protein
MKKALLILITFLFFGFASNPDCGDATVYANKKQTENDKRFDIYPKIKAAPKYKGGDKKLDELIRSKLKLSEAAKTLVFNLNYQFTVTCDGKVKDVKQIGDSKADDWTNIVEIILSTEADWTPAKKDGKTVDCVYFRKLFINGSEY